MNLLCSIFRLHRSRARPSALTWRRLWGRSSWSLGKVPIVRRESSDLLLLETIPGTLKAIFFVISFLQGWIYFARELELDDDPLVEVDMCQNGRRHPLATAPWRLTTRTARAVACLFALLANPSIVMIVIYITHIFTITLARNYIVSSTINGSKAHHTSHKFSQNCVTLNFAIFHNLSW